MVGVIQFGIMDASDTEVIVNQVSDLFSVKESVGFLSILFLQTDRFLELGILDNLVQCWCNPRVEHLKNQEQEQFPE